MFDTAIYIGRFQPFHLGHYQSCKQALASAKRLIILLGSAQMGPIPKDPWSFSERSDMIRGALDDAWQARVIIEPMLDSLYDQTAWEKRVVNIVAKHTERADKIALVAYAKDQTSFYLEKFPQWSTLDIPLITDQYAKGIDATDIREALWINKKIKSDVLSPYVADKLSTYLNSDAYQSLLDARPILTMCQQQQIPQTILMLKTSEEILLEIRQSPLGQSQLALPSFQDEQTWQDFKALYLTQTNTVDWAPSHSVQSILLDVPYQIMIATVKKPVSLPNVYVWLSYQALLENDLFADHRSLLYRPLNLNY